MTTTTKRILMMGFIPLLQVTGLAGTDGNEASVARIKVRIWDRVHIEAETLNRAKAVTETLYRPAGIEIMWLHCTAEPTQENLICACPKGFNDISVRICPRASGIILLLYDRLEKVAKTGQISLELVLGI